jgi:Cu+-exporting ATPase
MEIDPQTAFASREHLGQTFYFCSQSCVEKFDSDPHQYAHHVADVRDEVLAGSLTTGFNPSLPLARLDLPIVGLRGKNRSAAQAVETALRAVAGVRAVKATLVTGVAALEYDPGRVDLETLLGAVKSAGYRVGGAQTRIGIENLRCASCVGFIEEELRTTPGVLNAVVNIGTQEASVEYLPEKTTLAQLRQTVETWGYKTRPAISDEPVDKQQAEHEREYRRLRRKFWFAAIVSLPVLVTAYPQYIPIVREWSAETVRLAWTGAGLLTLPVLL